MRAVLPAFLGGLLTVVGGRAFAQPSVEWKHLDVHARLDNDGRFHVTETHRLGITGAGGFKLSPDFGRGTDQALAFRGITRIDAAGEHPLVDRGRDVEGPDEYRYYPRGHVVFMLPTVAPGTEITYRLEYELVNAAAPAWAIGAGAEPLVPDLMFARPWRRAAEIAADLREAAADPSRLYRVDHDVLFPSRDAPGYEVRGLDYRLEFGTAWRLLDPEAELARVTPDVDYRVRRTFVFLGEGVPPAVAWREAATRWMAVGALPVLGLVFWLLALGGEALTSGRAQPIRPDAVAARLLSEPPEVVAARMGVPPPPAVLETVLSRLVTEGKIAVEWDPPATPDDEITEVRMRRLVPRNTFPEFERAVITALFGEHAETSSTALRRRYQGEPFDPEGIVRTLLSSAAPPPVERRWTMMDIAGLAVALFGVSLQVRSLDVVDFLPFLILGHFVAFAIASGWPRGWWHGALPKRGLLVPVFLLSTGAVALHLALNRPLPAVAWIGSSLVVLAGHAVLLAGVRMPTRGPYAAVRELGRIHAFARRELRRTSPQLQDSWIPHLQAMGLGPEIEAWKRKGGRGEFTGNAPALFQGPPGWTDALFVYQDEEVEERDDEGTA